MFTDDDDDNDKWTDRIKKPFFLIQGIMKRGQSLEKMDVKVYTNTPFTSSFMR